MDFHIEKNSGRITDSRSGLEERIELSATGLEEKSKYDIVLNSVGEYVIDYNRRIGQFPSILDINTKLDEYDIPPDARSILLDYALSCSELLEECLADRKRAAQQSLRKIASKDTLYWIAVGAIAGTTAGSTQEHPVFGGITGAFAGLVARVYLFRRDFIKKRDHYAERLEEAYTRQIESAQERLNFVGNEP